jgi:hypothetical protein
MDRLVRKNGRLWKFNCGAHCGQWVLERHQNNFGSGPRESDRFRGRWCPVVFRQWLAGDHRGREGYNALSDAPHP